MGTYETVAEPTGMVSKYWDGGTAVERATKRIAKQRLVESAMAEAIVESARSEDIVPEMPVKNRSWLTGVAALGVSVARDFGPPRGVVFGKIICADDGSIPHSYHCNYTDGEEAFLSSDELLAGYELFGAMALGTYKPVQALECNGSSEEFEENKRRQLLTLISKHSEGKHEATATLLYTWISNVNVP
jgi:hypothetical protein